MRNAKIILGFFFLVVGIGTASVSIYLLQDDRLKSIFGSANNVQIELILLLLFSILLTVSGASTLRKETKSEDFKQSELLDD